MSKPKLDEIEKIINQIWGDQPDGETSPEEYAKWLRRKLRALVRKTYRSKTSWARSAELFEELFGCKP